MLKATLTDVLADLTVADAMVTVYAAGLRAGTVEENCKRLSDQLDKVRAKVGLAVAHVQGCAGMARRLGAEVGAMLDGACGGPGAPGGEKSPAAPRNTVAEEMARLVDGATTVVVSGIESWRTPQGHKPRGRVEVDVDKAGL